MRSTTSSCSPAAPAAGWLSHRAWLFACVCLIWGLTWIPIKVGVAAVPPLLFAAARGTAAGLLLLLLHWRRAGIPRVAAGHWMRLVFVATLSYAATYGLLFHGVRHVESGLAAVVNLSLVPTSLLLIGAALGEERLDRRKVTSTVVGVAGLCVLYADELGAQGAVGLGGPVALGLASIVAATLFYSLGVVSGRELLRHYPPAVVAGWTQALGALLLLGAALVLEPVDATALASFGDPAVLASLAFLVVFGSAVAFTFYLRLTHEWSPHRAGLYAFVSPAIAVVAGVWVLGETLSLTEVGGMALMLGGTVLALGGGRGARGRGQEDVRR